MYIKAISSILPGLNNNYGELYSTQKILKDISVVNSIPHPPPLPDFIELSCGVKSVALTHDTINAAKEKKSFVRNNILYEMLDNSVERCLKQLAEKQPQNEFQIKFHIHIVTLSENYIEFRLKKIRGKYNLPSEITTYFIMQGCAGVLDALQLCEIILSSEKNINILITGENNMATHISDRYTPYASVNNMDNWLWHAIFGEGVGAMIVGNAEHPPQKGFFWKVSQIEKSIACNDWRVTEIINEGKPQILVRGREVRQTYLSTIPKKLAQGSAYFNHDENITYILHESNPKMVQKVANEMGLKNVPTISEIVGTTACVSCFSLLDIIHTQQHESKRFTNIVAALIGEGHGNIAAGYMCLTPFTS